MTPARPGDGGEGVLLDLQEPLYRAIQEASWATGVAMLDSDVVAFRRRITDALLPVVRAYADQRAAEELRAAATEINEQRWRNRNGIGEARDAEQVVRARAAALAAAREQDGAR